MADRVCSLTFVGRTDLRKGGGGGGAKIKSNCF